MAKREQIVQLVSESPIKSIDTPGFKTWRDQIMPEEKGVPFLDLGILDLDIIIGAMEARQDKEADNAAENNGALF